MSRYAGTKTEKNLEAAFSGESQARNKYTYFASVAKKEGYEQIAALFLKTADNEKEHAKMESAIPLRILQPLLLVKTTSGPICTRILRRPPMRKVSMLSQQNSVW